VNEPSLLLTYRAYSTPRCRFHKLAPMYYRKAQLAILTFDITNWQSFQKVQFWKEQLEENGPGPEHCTVLLCGNKSDREIERKVQRQTAEEYAKSKGLQYMETSAKEDTGVKEMFEWLGDHLPEEGEENTRAEMEIEPHESRPKKGCCGR